MFSFQHFPNFGCSVFGHSLYYQFCSTTGKSSSIQLDREQLCSLFQFGFQTPDSPKCPKSGQLSWTVLIYALKWSSLVLKYAWCKIASLVFGCSSHNLGGKIASGFQTPIVQHFFTLRKKEQLHSPLVQFSLIYLFVMIFFKVRISDTKYCP